MFSFIYMYTYLWTHILGYFILTRRNQLPFPVTESLKKHQEVWKWWLYSNQTFPGRIFLLFQLKSGTAHKTDSHCRNLPLSQNCNFPSLPKLDCALGYPVWWHPPPTCNPTHFLIVHTTLAVDISETLWMPKHQAFKKPMLGILQKLQAARGVWHTSDKTDREQLLGHVVWLHFFSLFLFDWLQASLSTGASHDCRLPCPQKRRVQQCLPSGKITSSALCSAGTHALSVPCKDYDNICTHTKASLSNGNPVLVIMDENKEQGKRMVILVPMSFPASGSLWLKDSLCKRWSLCIQ